MKFRPGECTEKKGFFIKNTGVFEPMKGLELSVKFDAKDGKRYLCFSTHFGLLRTALGLKIIQFVRVSLKVTLLVFTLEVGIYETNKSKIRR